ncbi:MAG: hypothetical protein IJ329_00780 [Clostridia bacterium]|nr:hypothetical protein [Clostridia bacterium]
MNNISLLQDQEYIDTLKKYTIFLFRIKKWSQSIYSTFINLVNCLYEKPILSVRSPEYFFRLTHEESINFWKQCIASIEESEYANQKELIFLNSEEEEFYNSLPNDVSLLSCALYFLMLPHPEQLKRYEELTRILIYHYEDKYSKKEQNLLADFHFLSAFNKTLVCEYAHRLAEKQLKQSAPIPVDED